MCNNPSVNLSRLFCRGVDYVGHVASVWAGAWLRADGRTDGRAGPNQVRLWLVTFFGYAVHVDWQSVQL